MKALYVAFGAGFGAAARYVIDVAVKKLHTHWIPFETLGINIAGSFMLGLVLNSQGNALLVLGTGFAGAFTTWSTLAVEAHALVKTKNHAKAFAYLVLTFILGIGAAGLGIAFNH
jgi:CrcB protein